MSRYCGEIDTGPILAAAARWRDVALLDDGSVFSDKRLWTMQGLEELEGHSPQNLTEVEGNFIEKLKQQLSATVPSTKQLAAEMMWLMYLCPSSIRPPRKRDVIQTIWSWSGETLPPVHPLLDDTVLSGIGSAGPGFNQNQWRELAFLINFSLAFRRLSLEERKGLLADAHGFSQWLRAVPEWDVRQLRHMLLFLLFPDNFERIFGKTDRRAVGLAFSGKDKRAIYRMDPIDLDHALNEIRKKQEAQYGTSQLDFYVAPLKQIWKEGSFSDATETITETHVRQAIADIEREGVPKHAESTGYDLIDAGRRFPPKLVLSKAARHANGQELDRGAFPGGEASSAFRVLRRLGFEIEPKEAIPTLIQKFIEQARAATDLTTQDYLRTYRGLEVKVSFGKGNFARIPWISFLANKQTVSRGIYPVLLLFREQNVLLLCYSISEENDPSVSWGDLNSHETVQSWFNKRFGRNPERYGSSYVHSAYELDQDLSFPDLNRNLDLVIDEYKRVPGISSVAEEVDEDDTLEVRPNLGEAVRSFSEALQHSFVTFGPAHDELIKAFLASLLTKPFVILTGLSGSGKTQIALRLGEWLGANRMHVAAVRPDWTGAEALFGYEDGLKPAIEGRAAWAVPAPLAFMLKALEDPDHPYLLLLDEMNLAHVERYFADVLSGMESAHPCLPNLSIGSDGSWRQSAGAAPRVPFPKNLWIVGTVNVDETTYMFSPKVLDRANTFEFRVDAGDLQPSGRKPTPCLPADQALVRGLLSISSDDNWQQTNPATFSQELGDKLRQAHTLLARYGLEFGHRVYYESLRFAALAEVAGLQTIEEVLDRIVMQKMLPRLHGSRKRLELPLLALTHYCRDLPVVIETDENLPTLRVDQLADGAAKLPISYRKLCRMLRNLRANQFVSFTE
jgi:5-methylcytosine-specific restriction enzyme B